jgi:hypothetical protein
MEMIWKFLLGGLVVSILEVIGDVVRPEDFAGLFAAAPSYHLARQEALRLCIPAALDCRAGALRKVLL